MKKLLFIQGGGDNGYQADKKLVDSLKQCIGNAYEINYPEIESKEDESDYGWAKQIGNEISKSEENLILIGHSFGASMILKYLSENSIQKKLNGVFLIATPFWKGNEDWVQGLRLNENFADQLPENVPIFFYHCKDDKEIPFSHLQEYRERLKSATYREIDNGGHQLNNDLAIVAKDISLIGN